MLIIPAIDLEDGKVVRYVRGKTQKKIYSADPIAVALEWQRQGARFMHLVDLDGAFSGKPKNLAWIKKIISKSRVPVEVGGGIRSNQTIKKILKLGAKRVILGTKAIEDLAFLKIAISNYGDRIALSLDAAGARPGLYGWRESSLLRLGQLLERLEGMRLERIIFTDILRDGTMRGINITKIKKLLESTSIKLITAGGVSSLNDIKKLLDLRSSNLEGVIVGKALYEGRFSLKEAISLAKNNQT